MNVKKKRYSEEQIIGILKENEAGMQKWTRFLNQPTVSLSYAA